MSERTTKDSLLSPATKTILLATFVAGTLDILSAIIVFGPVFGKVSALRILQGIASALLGKPAFQGGWETALFGLLVHYCISLTFVSLYFLVFPYIPFLKKNKMAGGLLYGFFIWMVMNMAVLPLIGLAPFHFRLAPFLKNALILMLVFGIPLPLIIPKYYSKARSAPIDITSPPTKTLPHPPP
jgi:hypothetical protein